MKPFSPVLPIALLLAMALPIPAAGQEEASAQASDSTTAILKVRGGGAAETARLLEATFNGSRTAGECRVVVFAVPGTDYLCVKATSADLQAIRRLVRA